MLQVAAKDKQASPAPSPGVPSSELKRKLVHIGVGSFALALRFLTPVQAALCAVAAFVFNWQILPRIGGKSMWRSGELVKGRARGILRQATRDGHEVEVPGVVPKLMGTPGTVRSSAPRLGDDTDAVLAEIGFSARDIAALRDTKVVA